jgi:hypothetical protein
MKKFRNSILAAVALTLGFTACNNDDAPGIETVETTSVSLRIADNFAAGRAIEAPGVNTVPTIELDNGWIFISNPAGVIQESIELETGSGINEARHADGQPLGEWPTTYSVFVVGNIPLNSGSLAGTNISDVIARTYDITTQTEYKRVALSNATGAPAVGTTTVVGGTTTRVVPIALSPVISRMELHTVTAKSTDDAKGKITNFSVTGVFVTNYHSQFTWGGGSAGTFNQVQSVADLTGWNMGDILMVNANSDGGYMKAKDPNGAGNVWAYNVPATGLPLFIIRISNIQGTPAPGQTWNITPSDVMYLNVAGYMANGAPLTAFQRGTIYRVGTGTGLQFGPEDLDVDPIAKTELKVQVTIEEWKLQDVEGIF